MPRIKLENDLQFAIERYEKRARLIVYKGKVENVCRKDTFKNLMQFIQSGEEHLFKGRLQLHKNSTAIDIIVKGKSAGSINTDDFMNYLKHVKMVKSRSIKIH
jgi:hypothetical protein